jgi:hypothetical protein
MASTTNRLHHSSVCRQQQLLMQLQIIQGYIQSMSKGGLTRTPLRTEHPEVLRIEA